MEFSLSIKMDSAAFGEDDYDRAAELARILRETADHLDAGVTVLGNAAALRDINGNTVGQWVAR